MKIFAADTSKIDIILTHNQNGGIGIDYCTAFHVLIGDTRFLCHIGITLNKLTPMAIGDKANGDFTPQFVNWPLSIVNYLLKICLDR